MQPSKNRCEDIKDELVPYVDGELSASDAGSIEEHLRDCAVCRGQLELHRQVKQHLDDSVDLTRPVASSASVTSAVRENVAQRRRFYARVYRIAAGIIVVATAWLAARMAFPPASDVAPVEELVDVELIDHLDVLEALQDEGAELSVELVQLLLDEQLAGEDPELDGVLDQDLENELPWDQL